MLRKARLGICVMHGEGTSLQALLASDILVASAEEALDLGGARPLTETGSAGCHPTFLT